VQRDAVQDKRSARVCSAPCSSLSHWNERTINPAADCYLLFGVHSVPAIKEQTTVYRKNVERFAETLKHSTIRTGEAAEALRPLIGEIVLTPGKTRGEVNAELRGELMASSRSLPRKKQSDASRISPRRAVVSATMLAHRASTALRILDRAR